MNDHEYWWDRSGPVDPRIGKLEELLSTLRYRTARPRTVRVGLLQASLGLAAAFFLVWVSTPRLAGPVAGSLGVRVVAGSPRIGTRAVAGMGTLSVGQWLTTDGVSAAEILVGERGTVQVEPGSKVCLLSADTLGGSVRLGVGMIQVAVWAPPRRFIVETPAGRAVDLGCEYTLAVDGRGHALLCVESGWVALEGSGRTSLVPTGAQCESRLGKGPGTPYLAGASPDYLELLRSFDFEAGGSAKADDLIERAAPCDAFSLVYLVGRVDSRQRGKIFDRVAAIYPPWEGITRAGIVTLESKTVSAWQDQFECFESELCRASCLPEVL